MEPVLPKISTNANYVPIYIENCAKVEYTYIEEVYRNRGYNVGCCNGEKKIV